MERETRVCQNCENQFTIEPEDFAFYEKIKVPSPIWCPECRSARRFAWRNVWHLYKRQETRTGQEILSFVPPESPLKIYDKDFWHSDGWDPLVYGREIDWSRPFLAQVHELFLETPFPHANVQSITNCEYCANASFSKNCYFSHGLAHTEDCAYVIWDESSKHCIDSHMTNHCEFCYGNVNMARCYQTFFSMNCEDCRDVLFSKDCVGCSDCVGCVGLRSKSYCIFNIPYRKEEYATRVRELDLGSYGAFEKCRQRTNEVWLRFPVKFMQGLQNLNVSGDYVYHSKNAHYCYRVTGAEDVKYCVNLLAGPAKDCYDYANWGDASELIYDSITCGNKTYNVKFSAYCWGGCKNVEYSINCPGSTDIFGCANLHHKQYCILNKQYSKAEYATLVPKIVKHMNDVPYVNAAGCIHRYGEFFPMEFSPFPYNISEAQELYPRSREWAEARKLPWREEEKRDYAPTKAAGNLADRISDMDDSVLKEVIGCAHKGKCEEECTGAFRIIPQELAFLQRFHLPLPRLCPNCRHYGRLRQRNIPRFFERQCQCAGLHANNSVYKNTVRHFHSEKACPNRFQTSYAPDRPEIVYCEQCYQAEVT